MSLGEKESLLRKIFEKLAPLPLNVLKNEYDRLNNKPIALLSEEELTKPVADTWEDRKRSLKQTPSQFISKHYAERFWRGFTRAHLKNAIMVCIRLCIVGNVLMTCQAMSMFQQKKNGMMS